MPTKACVAELYVGTVDTTPTTLVGFVTSQNWEVNREKIDITTSCNKAYLAGPSEITFTVSGFNESWPGTDPSANAGQAQLRTSEQVSLAIRPNGTGSGKPQSEWSSVTIDRFAHTSENAGAWQFSLSATANVAEDTTAQT